MILSSETKEYLFIVYVFMCMCVCVCVCMCVCVCARAGGCICIFKISILIYCFSPYSLEIGFLIELGAKLVSSRSQLPCLCPESIGVCRHVYSYTPHYLFRLFKLLNLNFPPIFPFCAMPCDNSHRPLFFLDPLPTPLPP